jgi:hypothetical protein
MLSRLSSFSGPLSPLFRIPVGGFTTDGLILRYEISDRDSYSGTNSVTDLVSNSDATLYSGPTYSINGYINFDGIDDYLSTNTSLSSKLSPTNTSNIISHFTWIYPTDNGVIVSELGQTTSNILWHDSQIEIVGGNLKFGLWTLPAGLTSSNSSIPTPFYNWYYVGLTYDGNIMRGYVNGQLAGTKNLIRATPSSLHYAIGASDSTSLGDGTPAKMKLGAFHVYNTALSQQQILNNYDFTKSNYIYTGSMSIWIDANDPASFSGGSVNDLSGNGYTHSLTSGATSSTIYGFKSFDCTTGSKRIVVDGTGPTLSTSGYTYVSWARIISSSASFRTLLYTKSPRYTPITIPDSAHPDANKLGYWDTVSQSSGYDISSLGDVWVQYSVVGDNSSQTFYINDTQVGATISYGSGGTLHDGLGNNLGSSQPFGDVGNMMLYNKKLTLDEIKQNYDALKNVYKNGNFVTTNLKLHFNPASYLSYPSSGTTVTDLTGNSLNGAMSNVTFANPYFTFNGLSSTITSSDSALLEPTTGDFSVEVWINYSVIAGSSRCVLSKTDGPNSSDWGYGIRTTSSGVTYMEVGNGGTTTLNSPTYTVTTNTWYQIVGVFTNVASNSIALYVNGISQGTPTSHSFTSIKNTTHDLSIGSFDNNIGGHGQWFNGKMGIVRFYNSALSASDVSKNFEANRDIYGI